ncbi:lipocalin family protein [Rhodococcus sp. IEGM 1379]|uniref:lipocalin family protein n=1 Tax=Rhodococcus sp. IEGM 1379 TaxID=3047086 RepID=UPI0024B65810|nr:lipocalin family protein [Rhodococcus sp. IEGM 1379]MDI9917932.1 lipocalin family protein [Rhodococcus sp. IEGM 1379]
MKWSGKSAIVTAVLCCALSGLSGTAQAAPIWEPLQPVQSLDVGRYVGDWYQLAAVPQPFNLMCAKDTQARYEVLDASNVSVRNTCTTWTGQQGGIVGNARVIDLVTNAQLHVSFPGVPTQEGLDGPPNYIVTYIADDYSWALVGDPLRLSGFVLSRSPVVDAAGWSEIRRVAEAQGYNACTILTSPTTEGVQDVQPLCFK